MDAESNLKLTQECLDKAFLSYQCDTFKIANVLVYHFLSRVFMDMDAGVYMKQRKSVQDCSTVIFDIHNWFCYPDHVDR